MIKLKKIIFILLLFSLFFTKGHTVIKDSIFATVGNKAVTRSDIINEIKIILILNGKIYSEEIKEQLDNAAIQSILKRTVKKIEIEKHENLRFNEADIKKELISLSSNLNMDVDSLKQTFATNGIDFSSIIDRISTDLLWNSLIFALYKDRLSININEIEDQLKKIDKEKKINEYLISEIIIKPVSEESLEVEIKKIHDEVEIKGFEQVAMDRSISSSAMKGGDLGWINENSISKDFKSKIIATPVGKISDPIFLPQGILFFKVRDKKSFEEFINLEEAKNQLVTAEKMKILNMYSLSHYDKLRRTISIVYY